MANAEITVRITDMPQLKRLLDAVKKVVDGDTGSRAPTHLGGCTGPLSDLSCECGLSDLRFAVQAERNDADDEAAS